MSRPAEISPSQLHDRLGTTPKPMLVDVRQPFEHETCSLPDSLLIPLGELSERLEELDPAQPIVVYCHHGIRSLSAAVFLQNAGFPDVVSLAGGIERWAVEIDPTVPRY
ncbi:MAG: sulfurtransferase [Deltaproteobacteria bacterium]|nr:sulfurtransferase [Deltaproteobacteria bacterium]